ncbi:MAG: prepilin-type N-terminal cleavage/methylation domain-containing protein [Verrucomicrobia bacterium]|nr:prepilin-type N-terminal cleavage/methylation domain-containing protein [Verrucomicrobiota bacterium]
MRAGSQRLKQRFKMCNKSGLTLIEVLIATLLLTIGLTSMLTAASRCLQVMKRSSLYQETQWTLNRGELDFPMLPTEDVEDWEVSGESYDSGLVFSRTVESRSEDEEDGLFVVTSRVTWSKRGRDSFEEVSRYMYVPEAIKDKP